MTKPPDDDFGELGPGFVTWEPDPGSPHAYPDLERALLAVTAVDESRTSSMAASDWAGKEIRSRIWGAGADPADVEVATIDAGKFLGLLLHAPGKGAALAASMLRPGLFERGVVFQPVEGDRNVWRATRGTWSEFASHDDDHLLWITVIDGALEPVAAAALRRFGEQRSPD
jgi:hypothetical protein